MVPFVAGAISILELETSSRMQLVCIHVHRDHEVRVSELEDIALAIRCLVDLKQLISTFK